jgi:hypothetical protein
VSRDPLAALLERFSGGSVAGAAAFFSPHATYREARGEPIGGRDAIAAWFDGFAASTMTWHFAVDHVIRDGARACVVYRFTVFGGEGQSARERAGCAIVRLDEGGLIADWREYEG